MRFAKVSRAFPRTVVSRLQENEVSFSLTDVLMSQQAVTEPYEDPVRPVVDAQGRTWYVYPVVEGMKVGATQRATWLCLECGDDRRFISPVPDGWRQWTDGTLLHSIYVAKPDLRDL